MPYGRSTTSTQQANTARTTQATVAVGAASVSLAVANIDRVALVVCNDHATQIVYLSLGGTAVVGQGIRLNAAGGSHVIDYYTGAVNAIATGAGTGVSVAEV